MTISRGFFGLTNTLLPVARFVYRLYNSSITFTTYCLFLCLTESRVQNNKRFLLFTVTRSFRNIVFVVVTPKDQMLAIQLYHYRT